MVEQVKTAVSDQQPTAKDTSKTLEVPPPPEEPKPVDAVPAKPATEQQLDAVEKQMTGFERATLRWAKAAVIMSGLAAAFVCLQWWEMHTGGKDTHDLAVAAGKQADRTKDLADRMKDQADQTKVLAANLGTEATNSGSIAAQAIVQANAAKSAAETARDALQIGNRPWIKITPAIGEPLSFSFVGQAGRAATMTTQNIIENVGSSVALHVLAWEDVIPLDPDGSMKTALARREQWCSAHLHIQKGEMSGSVLFPHDRKIERMGMGPLMTKVDEAKSKNVLLPGKVGFVLVGCVSYRSSFEPDTASGHQTRFVYQLGIPQSFGGFQPYIDPTDSAGSQLRLIDMPDGFTAD